MQNRYSYGTQIKRACIIILSLISLYSSIGNVFACGSTSAVYLSPSSVTLNLGGPSDRTNITGTVLGGWSTAVTAILNSTGCPNPTPYSTWGVAADTALTMTVVNGGVTYPVYPTGVANIGYIALVKDPNRASQPIVQNPTLSLWNSGASGPVNVGVVVQVLFVATGPLQPGTYNIPSHKIGEGRLSTNQTSNNNALAAGLYYNGLTITVTGSTCAINSGDQNKTVTLPTVSTGGFAGIGSVASASQPFIIGLNCQAGIALYATMTDVTTPGNTSNTLSLAGTSTASGVGLQLLANGASTPLSFGPASSARGNLNQWYVGGSSSSVATNYNIPFIARYVKTSNTLVPGTVNAISTITFSYQ